MANNRVLQWATFARTWWIFDANHQCHIKSAKRIALYLQGKHKPIYHPLSDIGDHVVVINTAGISMRNDFWRKWKYNHHTGYAGGHSVTSAWRLHELDQTKVVEKSVYATLPGNLLRRRMMRRLHLFTDDNVPDDILQNVTDQIRQVTVVPRLIQEYTQEELDAMPKLFDWPDDYEIEFKRRKEDDEIKKYLK
ncbi:hypothetical protein LOTGIDRAFT_186083 [Lottia gigantea]|uniref:39S ribosomal protein L13, mitochondrial n=1 Tax=Lottia gigantea TaxID=225164 RepID=V4CGN4_LOTGI|nr:hypothetical protein LOTGIDRAFT_186083 [Lottia gigantea]ESP01255.1 hypothetical protein LOTGIDRAFT_186083 [Lottia gigantea]